MVLMADKHIIPVKAVVPSGSMKTGVRLSSWGRRGGTQHMPQGSQEDQRAIPDALDSLNYGFSNDSMPQNHLEGLLNHRVLGPAPHIFCFNRP